MRRTFLSFNKDGRAEERLDGFFPVVEVPKTEFTARRQGLGMREEEMFLVDEDLLLNHLLVGTPLKYDAKTVTLEGDVPERTGMNDTVRLSLDILRDDFGGRQKNEPDNLDWDIKIPTFPGN